MFTLVDLNFESDLHEAMETLPEDLEAVYVCPSLDAFGFCLFPSKVREDTLTPLWRRENYQSTYYHTDLAMDASRQASIEKV